MAASDVVLLAVGLLGLVSIMLVLLKLSKGAAVEEAAEAASPGARAERVAAGSGLARMRNRKGKHRRAAQRAAASQDDTDDEGSPSRRQATQEARRRENEAARDAQQREEKPESAKEAAYREKLERREAARAEEEAAARDAAEEAKKKSQEEFDKWKGMFTVEASSNVIWALGRGCAAGRCGRNQDASPRRSGGHVAILSQRRARCPHRIGDCPHRSGSGGVPFPQICARPPPWTSRLARSPPLAAPCRWPARARTASARRPAGGSQSSCPT